MSYGKMGAKELAAACNITVEEAGACIAQYDEEGNGELNPEEFEDLKNQILEQQREVITDKLSANDYHDEIDADGDGQVSAAELAAACGISEMEAQSIISQYDPDGDGMLNPEEFEDLKQQILAQQRENVGDKLNEYDTFGAMDDNADDKLTAKELAEACNISELQASNLIAQYDGNQDGFLDKKEFDQLKERILKEQAQKLQQERQERQAAQQQQYEEDENKQKDSINPNGDEVQEFKHKWKFGMNFDPKMENVVIFISDEITKKNWGITLTKTDFDGPIRQEYRKLGGVVSNGSIKYDFPSNGGPLGVHIEGKNGEKYNYSCDEQY